jgi:putative ABC transport system permease protein
VVGLVASAISGGLAIAFLLRYLSRGSFAPFAIYRLALAAGVVVLYAALAGSRDERVREAGLMRALGASRSQLTRAQVLELALSGLLAGALAAIGAILVGWVLATQVFDFAYRPGWWLIPAGTLAGGLFSAVAGWWSLRSVVRTPPMASLRGV